MSGTAGGPGLAQVRHLTTELPGPESASWAARKEAAVPRGVGTTLPAYVTAAGAGCSSSTPASW